MQSYKMFFPILRPINTEFKWLNVAKDVMKATFKFESFQFSNIKKLLKKMKVSQVYGMHHRTVTSQAFRFHSKAITMYHQVSKLSKGNLIV